MRSAFSALNISSVPWAFARAQQSDDDDRLGSGADSDPARDRLAALLSDSEQDPEDPATRRSRKHRPLRAHGERLRREIINVPGRPAHHARGLTVHLHPSQHDGPLVAVHTALAALPSHSASYSGPRTPNQPPTRCKEPTGSRTRPEPPTHPPLDTPNVPNPFTSDTSHPSSRRRKAPTTTVTYLHALNTTKSLRGFRSDRGADGTATTARRARSSAGHRRWCGTWRPPGHRCRIRRRTTRPGGRRTGPRGSRRCCQTTNSRREAAARGSARCRPRRSCPTARRSSVPAERRPPAPKRLGG
jgi:hypothetical protein